MSADIGALKSGDRVSGSFLVIRKERKLTKAKKPYCDLLLGHRTGVIAAKIWDIDDDLYNSFDKESVVEVAGSFDLFNDQPQIKIDGIRSVDDGDINYADFLPTTSANVEELQGELFATIDSIQDVFFKRLIEHVFNDDVTLEAFLRAPAAKNFHHAYIGGLLEHTVGVAKLCDTVAANYPGRINRSLLISGALLHDIGKIREFSYSKTIDYSTEGRLIGHLVLGYEMTLKAATELGNIPDEVTLQLTHLILSHHGSYEFQSPRKPKTLEALLLHLCDDADAKINAFTLIGEEADDGAEWSPFNKVLQRFVYLKKLDDAAVDKSLFAANLDI